MGYACALAVVLFAIIFVFTWVQWRYGQEARQEW
jgi:ABC-type sugar transport system permease subunit